MLESESESEAVAILSCLTGHDSDVTQEVCLLVLTGKIRYSQLRSPERYLRRVAGRLLRNRQQHEAQRQAWDQRAGAEVRRVQAPEQLRLAEAWEIYSRVERLAPTLLDAPLGKRSPAQRAHLYRARVSFRQRFGVTSGSLAGSI